MADTDIKVNKAIFDRINRKKSVLNSKRPLPKTAINKLHEEFRLLQTYNSNAIEGNTLTIKETKLVIEEGITVGGKSLKEYLEATGNANAFNKIEELAQSKSKIDHLLVQEIHEIVTKGWLPDSGKYRIHNVRIAGAKQRQPDFSKVPKLMSDLFKQVNQMKKHPIILATYFHHRFVEIHPFSDGNGRVTRLLTNLILMQNGFPAIVLKKEDRMKYYQYLEKADKGDLSHFVNFIAKAVDESLTIYLAAFGGKSELMPLADLAKRTDYSQEYLSLRARQGVLDAVKINNIWHSSAKALDEYINTYKNK
jgi:Fic family protein